jgi:hypothetical protein
MEAVTNRPTAILCEKGEPTIESNTKSNFLSQVTRLFKFLNKSHNETSLHSSARKEQWCLASSSDLVPRRSNTTTSRTRALFACRSVFLVSIQRAFYHCP